ncbi:manganese transport protein [Jatrophihabitans endophyticus]|uniref:Manganese transport protein n=1 Tax=Jatrophihabitans endophyticus TaxID=1206085 RepID=A0A1M5K8T1_9ACTN|nr:Nramp family divalent metal transporter [Jatrophihabitans endophyticus]SHG49244.1 manganese transport protein [Jatrophihabitans endophyticus]
MFAPAAPRRDDVPAPGQDGIASGRGPGPATTGDVGTFASLRARGRLRGMLGFVGPAFVAAVAYIDPGNFATNFSAGAHYGYTLVWVVVAANLVAMLVQYQSAKVGVATGRDLPELCRDSFPRGVSVGLWLQAEVVAMATDVAEFVGAAVGLYLIFGVPLLPAGLLTAVVAFVILALDQRGHRRFELVVAGLLGIVSLGFAYDLVAVGASAPDLAGGLVPGFAGTGSVALAAGIVGATVMPHVVYLHSSLTKRRVGCRDDAERRQLLRFQRVDVVLALGVAGLVNVTMIVVAASVFHRTNPGSGDSIEAAHSGLAHLAGGGAALAFAAALLASGLSSASVGTYAGQVVMQGFLRRRVPLFARRAVTMLPALGVLALGLPMTTTLVVSQVLLSFGIPFALVPLTVLAARRDVMGTFANRAGTTAVMVAVATVVIVLNGYVLYRTALG